MIFSIPSNRYDSIVHFVCNRIFRLRFTNRNPQNRVVFFGFFFFFEIFQSLPTRTAGVEIFSLLDNHHGEKLKLWDIRVDVCRRNGYQRYSLGAVRFIKQKLPKNVLVAPAQ